MLFPGRPSAPGTGQWVPLFHVTMDNGWAWLCGRHAQEWAEVTLAIADWVGLLCRRRGWSHSNGWQLRWVGQLCLDSALSCSLFLSSHPNSLTIFHIILFLKFSICLILTLCVSKTSFIHILFLFLSPPPSVCLMHSHTSFSVTTTLFWMVPKYETVPAICDSLGMSASVCSHWLHNGQ